MGSESDQQEIDCRQDRLPFPGKTADLRVEISARDSRDLRRHQHIVRAVEGEYRRDSSSLAWMRILAYAGMRINRAHNSP
jgi:hypothetical protein